MEDLFCGKVGEVRMSDRNRLCIKREFCNDDCMTCTKAVKVELMSEIINGKVITRPNGIHNGIHRDKGSLTKGRKNRFGLKTPQTLPNYPVSGGDFGKV